MRALGTVTVRVLAAVVVVCAAAAFLLLRNSYASVKWLPEAHPQLTWAPCNRNANSAAPSTFKPLSDAAAAALVTPEPEARPNNDKPYVLDGRHYPALNYYVPSGAQVAAFRAAKLADGETNLKFNPYIAYVDGRDGLRHPTTDELIQWAAHKWGIPEDWLRAEFVRESYWNGFLLGDATPVTPAQYAQYPKQAQIPGGKQAYQSMGLTQVRWVPGGQLHPGTEPLRWESTAFNLDYQASTLRFFYDNPERARSSWGDSSYRPCETWESVGGWFDPYPWDNAGQNQYIAAVKQDLAGQVWRSGDFAHWSQTPLPPGLKLR